MIEAIDWKLDFNEENGYTDEARLTAAKAIFEGLLEKGWVLPKWAWA